MSGRAVPLVLILCGPALPLAAQGFDYEGGLSLASGTYFFTERTTSWSLYTGLAWERNRVTLRASLPIHLQNTTLVALGHGATLPTGGSSSGVVGDTGAARNKRHLRTHEGMPAVTTGHARGRLEVPASAVTGYQAAVGDPIAQLRWRALDRLRTRVSVSLTAKMPVADTASFGTGQWDFGSSVAMSQTLGSSFLLGLDLSYWKLGDLSTLDFHDPVYGTASLSYLQRNGWGGGLTGSAGTSSLTGYSGPVSVGGFIARAFPRGTWTAGVAAGLSETAPDFMLILNWTLDVVRGV